MLNKKEMLKIGTQTIKGKVYVFEVTSHWDVNKKQTRNKRNYIGTLDANGELTPNKTYAARLLLEKQPIAKRQYYGATHLLDVIGRQTGVTDDLKACFPDDYLKILSLAYYLILENDSPMYRFKKWETTHYHPLKSELSSQRISELFASISEGAKMAFFKLQSKRRLEKEYLAYDTTSISSYSELIDHCRYGHNKDGDDLPQVNLALVFGEDSMLPVYYRKLPGNISDVTTVRKLLRDIDFLHIPKVKLIMDRGFYSADNINALYSNHYKFLIGVRRNIAFIAVKLKSVRETIKDFKNYSAAHDVYCLGSTEKWEYEKSNTKGKDTGNGTTRRVYVHIYYNGGRAEDEKTAFIKSLVAAERALYDDTATDTQKRIGAEYFMMKHTPVRGLKIEHDEKAIRERMERCGYFVLLSNEIKDTRAALDIYRNKDLVEKAFCNLKNRLDMKRTAVSSSENLEGKLFVQFVALIFISFIHKRMKEKGLYENYSIQTLLDELDIIERFEYDGRSIHYSEITKKQTDLFACFGISALGNML